MTYTQLLMNIARQTLSPWEKREIFWSQPATKATPPRQSHLPHTRPPTDEVRRKVWSGGNTERLQILGDRESTCSKKCQACLRPSSAIESRASGVRTRSEAPGTLKCVYTWSRCFCTWHAPRASRPAERNPAEHSDPVGGFRPRRLALSPREPPTFYSA